MTAVFEVEMSPAARVSWTKTAVRLWRIDDATNDHFVTSVAEPNEEFPLPEVAIIPTNQDGYPLYGSVIPVYQEDGRDVVGAIQRSPFDFEVAAELVS